MQIYSMTTLSLLFFLQLRQQGVREREKHEWSAVFQLRQGLRHRMWNLALMIINELLMGKSLITHIIFRLIFFFPGVQQEQEDGWDLSEVNEQEISGAYKCLSIEHIQEFFHLRNDELLRIVIRRITAECSPRVGSSSSCSPALQHQVYASL